MGGGAFSARMKERKTIAARILAAVWNTTSGGNGIAMECTYGVTLACGRCGGATDLRIKLLSYEELKRVTSWKPLVAWRLRWDGMGWDVHYVNFQHPIA